MTIQGDTATLDEAFAYAEAELPRAGATITIWSNPTIGGKRRYQAAALVKGSPVGEGDTAASAVLDLAAELATRR